MAARLGAVCDAVVSWFWNTSAHRTWFAVSTRIELFLLLEGCKKLKTGLALSIHDIQALSDGFAHEPSDAELDPEHEGAERRRNAIAAVAEQWHRRMVASAFSLNYADVLPRAVEIAEIWGRP